MSEEDKRFTSKDELKEWLKSRGVYEEEATESADKLYGGGYDMPSKLLGATPDELVETNISRPVARHLSNKLAQLTQPPEEQVRLQVQQLALLKLVAEEVNKTRKSRLNCWERESARTTGSQRSSNFRKKVINYYHRESSSRKSVKCQILDKFVTHTAAQDTIIAAHIWKASTRGKDLEEFGLREEDVNNPKNGLFLTKGIEDAFDNQRVCFLYNTLNKQLFLWVADSRILSNTIEGSNPPKKFSDVHQKPLCCPDQSRLPFRRLLSWHARLTLELRKANVQLPDFTSEFDLSPGRQHTTLDPIAQAIDALVEPGDDASVSRS